ncbi:MAG TPA: MerR family transcriptional regulator [Anaerolineaceae bacterium]|nr:MerR family transcriptional regulator [Anaerolineaceae bacterium]
MIRAKIKSDVYTVKQLSDLAGVSPRTLHYYDQIGVLKPTQIGENGYRYYGEEALLRLQQILVYRQLDMPLENIKTILDHRDFDILSTLERHKVDLQIRINQLERLILTVDLTINHLKGKADMSKKQLFEGLSDEQQAEYEQEAMQRYDPAIVKASTKKYKGYSAAEKQRIADQGNAVYQDMLLAIPKGAASAEAQACVERWRRHLEYFWTPNEEQLLGLAELYSNDPRFKANFDKVDPRLAEFMQAAVKVYVANLKY